MMKILLRRLHQNQWNDVAGTRVTKIDVSTKGGGRLTSELFTMILCGPNFVVSRCT